MQNDDNIFCLDPSCFTSLKRWKDTLEVLDELTKIRPSIMVYLSSELHDTIMLQPDDKFPKLLRTLEEWLAPRQQHIMKNWDSKTKDEYVLTTRKFIETYSPKKPSSDIKKLEKIGSNSIHRSDVIDKIGEIAGGMLFEMMALSSEVGAKIISFGTRTSSLIGIMGTPIIRGWSKFKHKIKESRGIKGTLGFMIFAMSTDKAHHFLQNYQIQHFPLTLQEIGTLGLLIIADGFG